MKDKKTTTTIEGEQWSILQLHASLPNLWTGVRLGVTLLWYRRSCISNVNYFVLMLTRYCSLSQQGHLQPHSKSKAWQLSTQLLKWPVCWTLSRASELGDHFLYSPDLSLFASGVILSRAIRSWALPVVKGIMLNCCFLRYPRLSSMPWEHSAMP